MWSADSRQWSSSSGYQNNRDWSKSKQDWSHASSSWWNAPKDSTPTPTVAAAEPVLPSHFKSDDKFFDSTAVGSGNHQFHRVVQSTDWFRKAQIVGRPVDDLRVHELCLRGMSEFPLRMISEGRFQSIVWTRNTAESVLVTQLLKAHFVVPPFLRLLKPDAFHVRVPFHALPMHSVYRKVVHQEAGK